MSVLSFKDNMLNVRLAETGRPTFGGCTGFGCGAAFNFMALLPDGPAKQALIDDFEGLAFGYDF